jgi:sugar phosphate permease
MFPLARRARPTMLRGIREGLSYAKHSRTVLVILGTMVVFASLCFNFSILLPVLAKQTLDAGPRTFGVLSASFGIGALVGALAAAAISRASWKTMFIGALGFAVCELAIAPMQSVPVDVVLLFVCGIFFTSYTANSNARIQLDTPDHLRGRVLSLYYYAWNGIAPLGALVIGWLSARGGTELAFAVAGAAGIAMAVIGALALRRPQRIPPAEELPEPGEALAA